MTKKHEILSRRPTSPHLTIKGIFILTVFIFVVISVVGTYNSIIGHDEDVKREWGNLQSSMQRRLDLIPNLVQTVKGYSVQESETLQKLVEARSKATSIKTDSPEAQAAFMQANNQLRGSLSKLIAVVENYPDLKASETYRDLMVELEGTENRINFARQNYNNSVRDLNASLRGFLGSMLNNYFLQLKTKDFFEASPRASETPRVDFGN